MAKGSKPSFLGLEAFLQLNGLELGVAADSVTIVALLAIASVTWSMVFIMTCFYFFYHYNINLCLIIFGY